MDTLVNYQIGRGPVNSIVTGRYLAHNGLDRVQRAFLASDLVTGDKQIVEYTILQAAFLAKVNATYVHWAIKQAANRAAIVARELPLVPPRAKSASLLAIITSDLTDHKLTELAAMAGADRWLTAALAAGL